MSSQPRRPLGPSEIRAAAAEFVSAALRDELAYRFVAEYLATKRYCDATFERPELHDVHAHIRRAKIEGAFRAAGRLFQGVVVESKKNAARNAYYTRLRVGPFALTESAVEFPDDVPRDAVFRSTLASGQLPLFEDGGDEDMEDVIFGVFLHGRRSRCQMSPQFLLLGFPEADCSRLVTQIDLSDELSRGLIRVMSEQQPGAEPLRTTPSLIAEERVDDNLVLEFKYEQEEKKKAGGGGDGA